MCKEEENGNKCPLDIVRCHNTLLKSDRSMTCNNLCLSIARFSVTVVGVRSPAHQSVKTVTHYQRVLHSSLGSSGGDDSLSFLL